VQAAAARRHAAATSTCRGTDTAPREHTAPVEAQGRVGQMEVEKGA